ncbi:MAG: xanthine dehydrogenase family protein subunit M [Anaerolineales bacterium]|nr:xanthine dehydrogenase family protein subunit M [Anaerolineales bacterium]
MYPANFDYYRPETVAEAVELLHKNKDAKVLAGGHSLLPQMKLRVSTPPVLVDIGRIKGLADIKVDDKKVTIGALTTHAMIAGSDTLKKACPVLAEAAALIGDVQVRNRGTIGGSLCHADPAADFPTVVVALGGTLTATGPEGDREIEADKFFQDLFTTTLKPGEILTSIRVPAYGNSPGMGGCYLKHRHPASSYAVVGVAAIVGLEDGKVSHVSLVIGGTTANPVHAAAAEEALKGKEPSADNIAAAAEKVGEIKATMHDTYASAEYRVHLAQVMAKRALTMAAERAKG